MKFTGISRTFSLKNEDQYNTIGAFWDEMEEKYGLENLRGLGYKWQNGEIYYAIGLKKGNIQDFDFTIELPDDGWVITLGKTAELKEIYDKIYENGALIYEIEEFSNDGECIIRYFR